jgi:hypothetical protein
VLALAPGRVRADDPALVPPVVVPSAPVCGRLIDVPGEPAARLALAPVTMVPRPMPATLPEAELALAPGSVRLTLSARLPGAVMASAPNRSDTAVWPTVPADVLACAPVRDTGMVAVDWPSGEAGRPSDLRARDRALNNQAPATALAVAPGIAVRLTVTGSMSSVAIGNSEIEQLAIPARKDISNTDGELAAVDPIAPVSVAVPSVSNPIGLVALVALAPGAA